MSARAAAGRRPGERWCAIHQPHYLPWLRYFDKIARADVFVVLDDVQYNKNGWQNRNRIKGPGGAVRLTVPVRHAHQARLDEVEIADHRFRREHLQSLRTSYGRTPGFDRFYGPLEHILGRPGRSLVELNLAMLAALLELLGIATPVRRSSELAVPGIASERLANICVAVGASHYLTGAYAAHAYLDPAVLATSGVGVRYLGWTAPCYPQAHPGAGFVADLSIVDLLASEPARAAAILDGAGTVTESAPAASEGPP